MEREAITSIKMMPGTRPTEVSTVGYQRRELASAPQTYLSTKRDISTTYYAEYPKTDLSLYEEDGSALWSEKG